MTGSFSDYYENRIVDQATGKNPPTTRYVALSTATITDTTTGSTITEPVGGNYARKATTATDWNNSIDGSASNATTITMNTPSATWGLVTYYALCDSPTGGQIIGYSDLAEPKTINTGDPVTFPPGSLTITQG